MISVYLRERHIPFQYLNLDNWLLPKEQRSPDMTVKDRYPYTRITHDFQDLLAGKAIHINTYDVKTRTVQTATTDFVYDPQSILLIDGVVSLDIPYLREIADLKIYCDIDESVRKDRFVQFYRYKGLSESEIMDLYQKRQLDEYPVVISSKQYSDCIISLN